MKLCPDLSEGGPDFVVVARVVAKDPFSSGYHHRHNSSDFPNYPKCHSPDIDKYQRYIDSWDHRYSRDTDKRGRNSPAGKAKE